MRGAAARQEIPRRGADTTGCLIVCGDHFLGDARFFCSSIEKVLVFLQFDRVRNLFRRSLLC